LKAPLGVWGENQKKSFLLITKNFMFMKKFIFILIALFCANVLSAQVATGTRLFLEPNIWGTGVRFTAFFFGGGSPDTWVNMTPVSGTTHFEVTVPSGNFTGVIFLRMRHDDPRNQWGNPPVYNQTHNQDFSAIGTNNLFTVTAWNGPPFNHSIGNWTRISVDEPSVSLDVPAFVFFGDAITLDADSENIENPVYVFSVRAPEGTNFATITSPYTPELLGTYRFRVEVATSANPSVVLATDERDVVVRHRIPVGTRLYFQPYSAWRDDDARFAVYFFTSSGGFGDSTLETWVSMDSVPASGTETGKSGNYFYVSVPDGAWQEFIFVRMDGSTTENIWDNCLNNNQTSDLAFDGTNDLYVMHQALAFWTQYGVIGGSFRAENHIGSGCNPNFADETFFTDGVSETKELRVLIETFDETQTYFTIFQHHRNDLCFGQNLWVNNINPVLEDGCIVRAAASWNSEFAAMDNTHTVILPEGKVFANNIEMVHTGDYVFTIPAIRTVANLRITGADVTANTAFSNGEFMSHPTSFKLDFSVEVPADITTRNMEVTFNLVTNEVTIQSTNIGTNVNTPNEIGNVIFTVGRTIRIEMEQENNRVMFFNSLGQMIHSADAGSIFEFTTASAGVYFVRVNESNYKVIVR